MMNKELDFIEWARNSGHGKTQVPMNLLEMILDYQKYVEAKFKNLDMHFVVGRSEQLNFVPKKGDSVIAWADTYCEVVDIMDGEATCKDVADFTFKVDIKALRPQKI